MVTFEVHAGSFNTLLGEFNYLETADGSRFWSLKDLQSLAFIGYKHNIKNCKVITHPLTGKVYYYIPTGAMINLLMSNVSDYGTLFIIKALLFEHLEPLTGYTLDFEEVGEVLTSPEDVKFAKSLIPS